jgi:hypothetical protein
VSPARRPSGRAPGLPNFLIIGAEKAATTWLARSLAEHPAIFVPPEKELFFFSSRFERGLDWYAEHFRGWTGEPRVGEATPVYLSHPDAPRRIRETLGEIELIVSLRHPVDRAYSAYWHNLRHGRISPGSPFRAALEADAWQIRSRGLYGAHLGRYLALFPRDRLGVLRFERIQASPARALRACLELLGVDAAFRPSTLGARLNEGGADITVATGPVRRVRSVLRSGVLWARRRGLVPGAIERRLVARADRVARRVAAVGPRARAYEPLPEGDRAELFERFYRADLDRLEQLLEMDLSDWRAAGPAERTTPEAARDVLMAGGSRST